MARKVSRTGGPAGERIDDASSGGRPAAGSDPVARAAHVKHLRRIRGQVEGIERMIVDGRYCADVITQITAARASLLSIAKALLAAHLKDCHSKAIQNGGTDIDDMYQELVDLVGKMAK